MPIDSICTQWNQSPLATRSFATAMAGVSGSSSTWIVPVSAASSGAKYVAEGFIAQSPWYVFFAMTFLRLLLPSGASIWLLAPIAISSDRAKEIARDSAVSRDIFSSFCSMSYVAVSAKRHRKG